MPGYALLPSYSKKNSDPVLAVVYAVWSPPAAARKRSESPVRSHVYGIPETDAKNSACCIHAWFSMAPEWLLGSATVVCLLHFHGTENEHTTKLAEEMCDIVSGEESQGTTA